MNTSSGNGTRPLMGFSPVTLLLLVASLWTYSLGAAFVTTSTTRPRAGSNSYRLDSRPAWTITTPSSTGEPRLRMLPTDVLADMASFSPLATTNNMWISTIDSDIASIPTNEFAPVFMGGIVVMFGGVLSALIVGTILEKKDLYANVVADSYAQAGADDEEFWRGLSEEEKIKAQALIQKLNANKQGGDVAAGQEPVTERPATITTDVAAVTPAPTLPTEKETVMASAPEKTDTQMDMFSDYSE